jgi:hypothetical protein
MRQTSQRERGKGLLTYLMAWVNQTCLLVYSIAETVENVCGKPIEIQNKLLTNT